MTRLSVCGLGVSCNEMNDTPMLLVVNRHPTNSNRHPTRIKHRIFMSYFTITHINYGRRLSLQLMTNNNNNNYKKKKN